MRNPANSQRVALVLSFTLLALMMFPSSSQAYGTGASWQLGFSGTGTLFGSGFGFWGWCTFIGSTSGTVGDCQVSQYLHGSTGNIQCETGFDVTGWKADSGVLTSLTGKPDFFVTSGSITVRPASATDACLLFLGAAGFVVGPGTSPGMLVILGPSDLELPAAPGHYNFNEQTIAGISFTEFQVQVAELP
jgi:hypothetical protein